MLSHILESKNTYLDKKNITIYDKTIFNEFTINCIGKPITPESQKTKQIMKRKKLKKKYTYSYDPSEQKHRHDYKYMFSNSSGNPIRNPKNLKLKK